MPASHPCCRRICMRMGESALHGMMRCFLSLEFAEKLQSVCVCRCPHCHTEEMCIAQLMAPLIAMLHEAVDWAAEAGEDYIQEEPVGVPSSWEWLTVAVFACPRQCARSRTSAFEEETVIVVNETVTEGGWAY